MKVLVLGADGMLGHKLVGVLSRRFETWATVRENRPIERVIASGDAGYQVVGGLNAFDIDGTSRIVATVRPQAIVNCIGIVKQRSEAKEAIPSILVNSLFPHRLSTLCQASGARLIHLSTDCVFSGKQGNYREDAPPDAEDLYGRTKHLGEVQGPGNLTLRTSIIGWERKSSLGLVEWFYAQRNKSVRGFRRAIFSGVTTSVLATLIGELLADHPTLNGIWHVAASPISKFELLTYLNVAFRANAQITPDDSVACDRSLCGERFSAETGFIAPPWSVMADQLGAELHEYHPQEAIGHVG